MLEKFAVRNFKNFKDELYFDLSLNKGYKFNTDIIQNSIIKTSLIYGRNGSGKSNLGLAIFDISATLTDKEKNDDYSRRPFSSLLNDRDDTVTFYYCFKFGSSKLEYSYSKNSNQNLLSEKVKINDVEVISYDHKLHIGKITLNGAENLNTNLNEKNISFVKYIRSNTVLSDEDHNNAVFHKFIEFVDNMLLFSSLESNRYQGYLVGSDSVAKRIIEKGKLKDFETFLKVAGIEYDLSEQKVDENLIMVCKFPRGAVNFYSIASKGTCTLALFYCWLLELDKVSLVFIDEFDAFYHNDLARLVVEEVKGKRAQAIITTHNTSIMDNDLSRPDCLFNLGNGKIRSFADSTDKELRKAHNIEKMYRAGVFDE